MGKGKGQAKEEPREKAKGEARGEARTGRRKRRAAAGREGRSGRGTERQKIKISNHTVTLQQRYGVGSGMKHRNVTVWFWRRPPSNTVTLRCWCENHAVTLRCGLGQHRNVTVLFWAASGKLFLKANNRSR